MEKMDQFLTVLKNIRDEKYKFGKGINLDKLRDQISRDIEASYPDTMAILGYFFKKKYAKIDPEEGFVLIYNAKTKKILNKLDELWESRQAIQ